MAANLLPLSPMAPHLTAGSTRLAARRSLSVPLYPETFWLLPKLKINVTKASEDGANQLIDRNGRLT